MKTHSIGWLKLTASFLGLLALSACDTKKAPASAGGKAAAELPSFLGPVEECSSTQAPNEIKDEYWHGQFQRVNKEVAAAENCQLVFFGDSITKDWTMLRQSGKKVWDERFAKYNPINMGNSGDITPVMLHRLRKGNLNFQSGREPRVAVLLCGTNNYAVTQSAKGAVQWDLGIDTPPAEVAEGVRAVAQMFWKESPTTRVIVLGILPVKNEKKQPKVAATNEILAGFHYPQDEIVYMDLKDQFMNADGTLKAELYTDGTHLTPKGYEVMADAIEPTIERLMALGPVGVDPQAARGPWKKHVVQEDIAPGEKGQPTQTNTVVADDFDKDGYIDVMASLQGKVMLYRGPDWKRQVVMAEMPKDRTGRIAERGCIHSCLMDVDGDGDMDYIGSNRMLFWLECPDKPFEQEWKRRMIHLEVNGAHCVITADVDRDGKLDLVANSWRDETETTLPNSIAWFRTPENPKEDKLWTAHLLAAGDAPGRNHYHGFADMNGDGRGDICSGAPVGEWFAWWEQPEDPTQPWTKHILSTDDPGATNILPVDLNGDGKLDFVASRGHGDGVLWYPAPDFKKVEIDPTLADPHCLAVADIDQDGDMDIATASCVAVGHVVWYENDGTGKFTRHNLEENQESYDLRILDMDKDGDLDLLHAGHGSGNIVWYENPLK